METCQSQENTKLATDKARRKMRDSRLMVFSLTVIVILAFLYLFSTVTIYLLTVQAINHESPEEITNLTESVSDFIHIDVATAIGTIATAVCARYLARETANNITGKGYTVTKVEEDK